MASKNIVLEIRANTKDAVKGAAEVRRHYEAMANGVAGADQKLMDARIKMMDVYAARIAIYSQTGMAVIAGVQKAVELVNFAAERARLMEGAGGKILNTLTTATGGLVSQTDLLRAANVGLSGDLALSENQMLILANAAQALGQKYGGTAEVLEKLTKAVATGSVDALKDFGIVIEGTKGKLDAQGQAMLRLAEISERFNATTHDAASASKDMKRALMEAGDGLDWVKQKAGEAISGLVYLGGYVADGFSDGMDKVAETTLNLIGIEARHVDGVRLHTEAEDARYFALKRAREEMERMAGIMAIQAEIDALNDANRDMDKEIAKIRAGHKLEDAENKRRAEKNAREAQELAARQLRAVNDFVTLTDGLVWKAAGSMSDAFREASNAMGALAGGAGEERTGLGGIFPGIAAAVEIVEHDFVPALRQVGEEMATVFQVGAIGIDPEIERLARLREAWYGVRVGVSGYGQELRDISSGAFTDFTNAAGEAFHMIASGQEGAADGFQEHMRVMLDGLGRELWAMSFKYLAIALAETIINPPNSGAHWAAFGVATAGAAAVSGVSGLAGAPGQGGVSAPSPGGGRNTDGYSASQPTAGPTTIQISVHGMFGTEDQAARAIGTALRTAQVRGALRVSSGERAL
jgi:hypothetical protein